MIVSLLLLAQAAALDPLIVDRGAALYTQRCSVPYCHGPAGTAGRAPALAGRNFDNAEFRRIVAQGIPSRGMPGFQQQLGDDGVSAVIAYVRSLPAPRAPNAPPPVLPPVKLGKDAIAGRDLFFDSSRLPGCSDCHAVGDMGAAVAGKLSSSLTIETVRSVRAEHVRTAHVTGEPPFPAVIAQVTADAMRLYDLSTPIPVMRSFPKSQVTLNESANWDHSVVVKRYTAAELELILTYIRER